MNFIALVVSIAVGSLFVIGGRANATIAPTDMSAAVDSLTLIDQGQFIFRRTQALLVPGRLEWPWLVLVRVSFAEEPGRGRRGRVPRLEASLGWHAIEGRPWVAPPVFRILDGTKATAAHRSASRKPPHRPAWQTRTPRPRCHRGAGST